MGNVSTAFYRAVLSGISAPSSTENIRACLAWQQAEGGRAANNPWNTTQDAPGTTWYNAFGSNGQYHVRNYPNEEAGIRATVQTLLNGHYTNLVSHLREGNSGHAVCVAVDASPWGTHGAARVFGNTYGSDVRPPVHQGGVAHPRRVLLLAKPLMHGSDVRQLQEALAKRGFTSGASGNDGIYGLLTSHAVSAFQHSRHLTVDGMAGPQVYHALGWA